MKPYLSSIHHYPAHDAMYAAYWSNCRFDCVLRLLKAGVDPTDETNAGVRAATFALYGGHAGGFSWAAEVRGREREGEREGEIVR